MFVVSGSLALKCPVSLPVRHRRIPSAAAIEAGRIDQALVLRCRSGDDLAFAEIVTRHRGRIGGLVRSLLFNRADADEVTQETFVQAHLGLARFRGDAALATWLLRIARNVAHSSTRRFFRDRRHLALSLECPLSAASTVPVGDLLVSESPDAAAAAQIAEDSAWLGACLRQLAPAPRALLAQCAGLHVSYAEIAASSGIGIGTVKSRIARARSQLRTLLDRSRPGVAPRPLPAAATRRLSPPSALLTA